MQNIRGCKIKQDWEGFPQIMKKAQQQNQQALRAISSTLESRIVKN